MERLTIREPYGGASRRALITPDSVVRKLADYEDTGFTPSDIKDMHNELCLKCGNYKNAHLGACNGCRWKKEEN